MKMKSRISFFGVVLIRNEIVIALNGAGDGNSILIK